MQDNGGGFSCKQEYRDLEGRGRNRKHEVPSVCHQHPYAMMLKTYGPKDNNEHSMTSYYRVTSISYESSSQQFQNNRNPSITNFNSPPNSPVVGLVFDQSSQNYGVTRTGDRNMNSERRSQNSWSISNQEPIGTGAKKKIVKSHDKRNVYNNDSRNNHDRYKDNNDIERRKDRNFTSESNTSLDFFAEGERMVSELCNLTESINKTENQKNHPKNTNQQEDKNKSAVSSEVLLTALDKIVIHDQIPNQIVQLAVEACTDAENIAIQHHNRPCFKNIHSICAKTRSNVQKPDSAVANLHSQGIPWVIKNFIFSFVRILDGWKGVKELLCEKHDTFSRIENKYYSPNIRECFVQWQAVTKEMLTHIYKTFKCLDHGFTMEQKSFTHNYYATNSAAPRHQNQNKFQAPKPHISTPRPVSSPHVSPQPYNAVQPPWMQQTQSQVTSPTYSDSPWPPRATVPGKKFPVLPPQSSQTIFHMNEPSELETFQTNQYKCDPCGIRESKPRQSWTITNVPDFRNLEGMSHADQRELYNQLKHNMDAELGKAPGQPLMAHMPCDLLQRREMELKAKMIPLSHVEKTLIPSMATAADMRACYLQKNNSCGDTKEEADFFAAWGQMLQKEPNDFLTHRAHNIQVQPNIMTITNNISGPVQFLEPDTDEYHEMTKVYMKPGSYKVPIKPAEPLGPFLQSVTQDVAYENSLAEEINALKVKGQYPQVTLAPQPKCALDAWPCLVSRQTTDIFEEEPKITPRQPLHYVDVRSDALDVLSSMTSDRAWEAAKQSAPKLMDFIHDGPKSDTARLYDALGLSADEFSDNLKQIKLGMERNGWPPDISPSHFMSKELPTSWDQQGSLNRDILFAHMQEPSMLGYDIRKYLEGNPGPTDLEDYPTSCVGRSDEAKDNFRVMNFDKSGNYIRDESQKKAPGNPKVATSAMWYQPKKKQPLGQNFVKKFETILTNFSQITEADFIRHDMDIKVAPRFYEVVKHPMCLHDIATKLQHSSYTESEQVVQDFRRIFNNVRLYLKTFPDPVMKKNLHKISVEFDKFLVEEFQNGGDIRRNDANADIPSEKEDKVDGTKTEVESASKSCDHKI